MSSLLESILDAKGGSSADPAFPHAPADWTKATASEVARQEGIKLDADRWDTIRALQDYYAKHSDVPVNMHELHDALDERFHAKGGIRYLYELFPGGPVAQGCRIAGLKAPAGAIDKGFGSVI